MPTNLEPSDVENILDSGETWVIDFWAEWCGPCKKLAPVFESVSEELTDVNFGKVNMAENQQLGSEMGVRALPTLLIVDDGEEVARNTGAMNEEQLTSWIKENT